MDYVSHGIPFLDPLWPPPIVVYGHTNWIHRPSLRHDIEDHRFIEGDARTRRFGLGDVVLLCIENGDRIAGSCKVSSSSKYCYQPPHNTANHNIAEHDADPAACITPP